MGILAFKFSLLGASFPFVASGPIYPVTTCYRALRLFSYGKAPFGNLASVCSPEFTKFTKFSETSSATPITVNFGIVSGSSLKFATT